MILMNKTDSKLKQLKALILFALVLSLSACGGKTVVTKDDSADYKSARSLPPLKKPSRVTYTAPPPEAEATQENPTEPVLSDVEPDLIDIEPNQQSNVVTDAVDESFVEEQIAQQQLEPTESIDTLQPEGSNEPQIQIISVNDNTRRLSIDADAKQAWQLLIAKLSQSDLTVHARNEKAGRFSIGCSGIGIGQGVVKRGGWAIFSRRTPEYSEYCSLLVTTSRAQTTVKVLDRSGLEATADSADSIFERLL